jgi:tetratricopeptide (TPR) repeat protein
MKTELSKIIDFINQGHYAKALLQIDHELKTNPNSFGLNKAKATTLFLQKKYNAALMVFNKCYEINPGDYDTNVNISFIFNMVQDYKMSLKFCNDALKVDRNRPEVYHNMAHCYLYIPDLEKAENYILKSIELRGGLESIDIMQFADTLNLYYFP